MTAQWSALTAYAKGAHARPTTRNGFYYRATVAGTSAATEPGVWPVVIGQTVEDGTVTWQCVSAVASELLKLTPSAVVELFVLDATAIGGAVSRYHCGTNQLLASVVWQGDTYAPTPIKCTGFEYNGTGKLPRPRLQIGNTAGAISGAIALYGELLGATLTRKRTLLKYLDAVNFDGGVNADADASAEFPSDVYTVDRRAQENKHLVEFELAPAFEVQGVQLPRRQIVQNLCPWVYRSAECGYAGGAVADASDVATAVLADDACGKRLASCKLRFGTYAELPFGGFPGAGLVR